MKMTKVKYTGSPYKISCSYFFISALKVKFYLFEIQARFIQTFELLFLHQSYKANLLLSNPGFGTSSQKVQVEFPPGIASGRIKTVPSQMMPPILMRSCVFRAAEILDGYCLSV